VSCPDEEDLREETMILARSWDQNILPTVEPLLPLWDGETLTALGAFLTAMVPRRNPSQVEALEAWTRERGSMKALLQIIRACPVYWADPAKEERLERNILNWPNLRW